MSNDLNLDSLSREQLAGLALDETLKALVKRVRSGEATAAELNVALNAAKHLNIGMVPTPGNSAGQLGQAITDSLPFAATGLPN